MAQASKTDTKTAAKTAAKAEDKDVTLETLRDVPTDEEHKKAAEEKKKEADLENTVKAMTVSGGSMYDPESDQWITGRLTLAANTDWIKRQVDAGKITLVD